jgi:hypothetical protein
MRCRFEIDSDRKGDSTLTPSSSQPLVREIIASLRLKFAGLNQHHAGLNRHAPLNRHYEAAWTESWCHRRCEHVHETLIDAAKCAASQRMPGWYVFAVEFDSPRQLTTAEDSIVNEFRFGPH